MGNRSGISSSGYHPAIWGMQRAMALREEIRESMNPNSEKWQLDFGDCLTALKAVDPDWETWWDSPEVPERASFRTRYEQTKERLIQVAKFRNIPRSRFDLSLEIIPEW